MTIASNQGHMFTRRLLLEQASFCFDLLGVQPGGIKSQIGLNQMLLRGDTILEVAGTQGRGGCHQSIQSRLSYVKPGDIITVEALRSGRILPLNATLNR